ncbi:MAG: hypothetical protein KKH06_03370 [Gammaproteobacteria bacterium]|nr:hypothetical protein [Gammaproteobacteria bacterium]
MKTSKSIAFFVSSTGDTQLAVDAAKMLAKEHLFKCFIIPLALPALNFLNKQPLAENSDISVLRLFNDETIAREIFDESKIKIANEFLEEKQIAHAYIGMPSPINEAKAMQLAEKIQIPSTFVYEYMCAPPATHQLWNRMNLLSSNPNLSFAFPLRSAFEEGNAFSSIKDRCCAIGHRSLDPKPENLAGNSDTDIKEKLGLSRDQNFVFVTGTTQPHETDTQYLNVLLTELAKHPGMSVRFGIHPGVAEINDYMGKILDVCEQHGNLEGRFKIILTSGVKKKLSRDVVQTLLNSGFVLETNVGGPDAASAATHVAQAVAGALPNVAVMDGKVVHVGAREQSHLPADWFADSVATFFNQSTGAKHTPEELGLDSAKTVAQNLADEMLKLTPNIR